ncbi:MAG: thioredoxin family protein [Candidatus Hydrothermarchaeaceae archaeon]
MPVDYRALGFAIVALFLILLLKYRTLRRVRSMEGLRLKGVPTAILDALGDKGLLYLYGPNCSWCARQKPIIEKIKASGSIPVVEVDITENPKVAEELSVTGTPTMVLVEGGVIKKYMMGLQSMEKLTSIFEG